MARPYFGPYTVVSLTPTNAEVKSADDSSIFVSLDRVRLCYDEMTNDVWTGTNKRSRKQKSIPTEDPKVAERTEPVVTRSMAHELWTIFTILCLS